MSQTSETAENRNTNYWRFAVWIAIGALIAAAVVCVVWVLIGQGSGIIPRAFLTIVLLAGFAGMALLDASLADRRPQWYVLLSMIGWVVILLTGAVKIWAPMDYYSWDNPFARFYQFLLIVLVVRLAILHVWLYVRSHLRRPTPFTTVIVWITVGLVAALALLLAFPLTFTELDYPDLYWRIVVAVAILAAVGTAIVPLVRALTTPRSPRPAADYPGVGYAPHAGQAYGAPHVQGYGAAAPQAVAAPAPPQPQAQPWPTYVDGVTPLPVMPDGSPDWNAYYTGHPTYPQHAHAPQPYAQQGYVAQPQQAYPPQPEPPYPPQAEQPQYAPEVYPGHPGQPGSAGQTPPPVPPVPPVPPAPQ